METPEGHEVAPENQDHLPVSEMPQLLQLHAPYERSPVPRIGTRALGFCLL